MGEKIVFQVYKWVGDFGRLRSVWVGEGEKLKK